MLATIACDARRNDVVDGSRTAPTYRRAVVSLQSVRTDAAVAASRLVALNQFEPLVGAEPAGNGTSTLVTCTLVGASFGQVCSAPSLPIVKSSLRVPSVSATSPRRERLLVCGGAPPLRCNQSIAVAPVILTVVGPLLCAIRRIGAVSLDPTLVICAFGFGSHRFTR